MDTGDYAKAEPLFQRSLAISEKALGPDHPDTATWLNNLASLYQATGAYAKAEPLLERAQRIEETNAARFLLSGAEARKRAYLQQRLGSLSAEVSFSLSVPDARAKMLGLTGVLRYKGRVLDAMADEVHDCAEALTQRMARSSTSLLGCAAARPSPSRPGNLPQRPTGSA
jgi:tetratricopeptide (TPR) repeat protein